MTVAQILAIVIFVGMFILIAIDKIEKYIVTLSCALLTIIFVFGVCLKSGDAILNTLNLKTLITAGFWYGGHASSSGINWGTVIFLFGMMVMVEGMARSGLFRWLCLSIAKLVKYKIIPILVSFMIVSFVLAMFIDSITVILFLAAVTIELAKLLKFDPTMMIIAEIFCANLGGSATMCGDPPNIIIGTSLGYSFSDFLFNTGLLAIIAFAFVLIYFVVISRKKLKPFDDVDPSQLPNPKNAITNKNDFIINWIIFIIAIGLLVSHSWTGLSVATIGLIIAFLTTITSIKNLKELYKKIDYKTLLFLLGLFIVVGGLEETGLLVYIANIISGVANGNVFAIIGIVLILSAVASAFVDNIPFSATMVPIIQSLAATQGVPLTTLAWTLTMGTDLGGCATPIGASANVVGLAKAKEAGYKISWGKYCLRMVPVTIMTLFISLYAIFAIYM